MCDRFTAQQPVLFHQLQNPRCSGAAHLKKVFDIPLEQIAVLPGYRQMMHDHRLHPCNVVFGLCHAGHLPLEQIVQHAQLGTDPLLPHIC